LELLYTIGKIKMSERNAPVVPIKMEVHPNADSLSIVFIDNFQVVVRTESWNGVELGCYIPPDEIVDVSRPEFAFLCDAVGKTHHRVKAKRLRQVWSMGLLIPAPDGAKVGDNLYEQLGLVHYEPENTFCTGGDCVKTPDGFSGLGKYDIENGRASKYSSLFNAGEKVWLSEKLHGTNCSVVYVNDSLYVHSRTQWPLETEKSVHWNGVRATPELEVFCKANPGWMVYGEVYGQVQKGYLYDCKPGTVKFRAFDVMKPDRTYLDVDDFKELCIKHHIPMVPDLGVTDFDIDKVLSFCERKSALNPSIDAEGIVVKPMKERYDVRLGRVFMKIINPKYLEKN
jgi:RNA ligase (TIGR02306 family)